MHEGERERGCSVLELFCSVDCATVHPATCDSKLRLPCQSTMSSSQSCAAAWWPPAPVDNDDLEKPVYLEEAPENKPEEPEDEILAKGVKRKPEDPQGDPEDLLKDHPMAKTAFFDEQVPVAASQVDPADEREYLQDRIIFSQPMLPGGLIERAERNSAQHLRFFLECAPNSASAFVYCPMWRVSDNKRLLDQLTLLVNADGKQCCVFNMKPPHGAWMFNQPPTAGEFLDIKLNVRYGEPDNEDLPTDGKWLRFQRVPATRTWMRIEQGDLQWVVVLCPLVTG